VTISTTKPGNHSAATPPPSRANSRPSKYPSLIQTQIKNISNELNNHKKEVQILRSEKDTLESVLTMKTADVKKSLSNELVRIE
jgi:hypothetical protein